MSAFSEWLEALGRIMGKPVVPRGERPPSEHSAPLADEPGPIVAAERELERRLADERPAPGRVLLHWSDSMSIPYAAPRLRERDRRRGRVVGTFHGAPFTVWFPAQDSQPRGHVWVLATWTAERSGTHRPEVLAACRTCSEAALAAGGPGTTVGPASCVIRNRKD